MTFEAKKGWVLFLTLLLALPCLLSCSASRTQEDARPSDMGGAATSGYIVSVLDEPDTTDFQCTTINYTIALNVFNRLVETQTKPDGSVGINPSLAKSWEISDDGLTYTFHLRDDVTFSNGSPLTSSDVHYSFVRLLTHPDSCNQDIVRDVKGAAQLEAGTAHDLEGFKILDDHTFQVTLEQPFSAFLACLCMPGASILDEESTEAAGDQFGKDPASTIGTGPFVFEAWHAGKDLLLAANPDYWEGAPKCAGVDLHFVYDPDVLSDMFKNGEIDILNVDDLGDLGDYFINGDAYQDKLHVAPHVGIDYIALNESVKPLDDVRVRKALQLSLDRQTLLDAAYSGAGRVEQGMYPHGLIGFNPDLEPIPYDAKEASRLLDEAGYADGFDLEVSMRSSSPHWQRQLMEMVISMWEKVGVRATITILSEDEFMSGRTNGQLACYVAAWAADYDDPDNFAYTFFGTQENTTFRSLCYANENAMARVRAARSIMDEQTRLQEYNDLERLIVQDDAAWVPLFSRERHFLVSDRVMNFTTKWNGWFEACYQYMSIRES